MQTMDLIFRNDEIWFSNPLFMHDYEELREGLRVGQERFWSHEGLKAACKTPERYELVLSLFDDQVQSFGEDHAFDIYVLCFSEHDENKDRDGLLSMWRGYGGDGNGAAIVLDTSKLDDVPDSPILLSTVQYITPEDRSVCVENMISELARILTKLDLPDEKLYLATHFYLHKLKLFSLFTKHIGFREENEWRAVYIREFDHEDRLASMLHYAIGEKGFEPKFKFKVGPLDGITGSKLSLESLIHSIVLGPSVSSILSVKAVQRMLHAVGKPLLADKLVASSTPYRPTRRS